MFAKDPVQDSYNMIRPQMKFPDSFEIGVSTNDFGLNITEIIYFDKDSKKLRLQLLYSIMGLEATKGLDLILDEKNKKVAVQSEEDCKQTSFHESLLPIQMFFSMFDTLTDYKGVENGLHKF